MMSVHFCKIYNAICWILLCIWSCNGRQFSSSWWTDALTFVTKDRGSSDTV